MTVAVGDANGCIKIVELRQIKQGTSAVTKCTRCGRRECMRLSDFLRLAQPTACGHCEAAGVAQRVHRRDKQRHCRDCYDLPHRRPRVGLCRGCGGAFREDSVAQ